jgi:hypothetical protein
VLLSTQLACCSCFQHRLACNHDFSNTTILLRVVSKAQKTSEFDGFPAQLDLHARLSTTCYSDPTCRSLREIRRISGHAGWAQLWIFSVGIISDLMAAQLAWDLVHQVLLNADFVCWIGDSLVFLMFNWSSGEKEHQLLIKWSASLLSPMFFGMAK